ncbi:hypothetical protein ACJQWK_02940 [Exserohilum turcicum]
MSPERKPPIVIPAAKSSDAAKSSAIIFIHGFGDDAAGIENIAHQFQSAGKLPRMKWILPNALENHELASTAWFFPTSLSPVPSSRPELEEPPDEEGIMDSVAYITALIDDLVAQGVPEKRIIVGGFSQGHAIAFLTGLVSKYAGKLGGLVGLSGFLPLSDRISVLREEAGLPKEMSEETEVVLARGTGDRLVPARYHRLCYERLLQLGIKEENITTREYQGMGHSMVGTELRDLCAWLEKVVPDID